MKAIKKISNLAIAKGYLKIDPFAGLKFRQPKTNPVFLTMEELERIMEKEFNMERVDLVRDVFVFCSWTGLAFIDVQNLKKEHIMQDNKGMYWIRKAREKTDTMCNIPLLDVPLSIIKKYDGHKMCIAKGTLLPVMCNQKMNSYLKEIADLCGIDKPLSTHAARHSFATVLKRSGANIAYISESLGHSSLAITENYLAGFEQEERLKNARLLTNFD